MKKEEITALFGKIQSISYKTKGIECRNTRELQLLVYIKWNDFINKIKVKTVKYKSEVLIMKDSWLFPMRIIKRPSYI